MFSLNATIRKEIGRATKNLREKGVLPCVLYGEGLKNIDLEIVEKDFEKIFKEAGESSLIQLEAEGKKYEVLIHQIQKDPVSGKITHIDFFHPSSKKRIEADIEIVFEGESPAVKSLGGVLVKELHELKVKGLAQKLPREIKVDISRLENLEDRIFVKDLQVPEGIEILREPDAIVVLVAEQKPEKEEKKAEVLKETTPAEPAVAEPKKQSTKS